MDVCVFVGERIRVGASVIESVSLLAMVLRICEWW